MRKRKGKRKHIILDRGLTIGENMRIDNANTPKITWMKEIVTATLGFIVIVGLLVLIFSPLTESPADIQTAQAVFSILGGWGGIVLGYYFGRMPAEKAAGRADAAASAAEIAKDNAVTTATIRLAEVRNEMALYREKLEGFGKLAAEWRETIGEL